MDFIDIKIERSALKRSNQKEGEKKITCLKAEIDS
jgi:hypothetical protein